MGNTNTHKLWMLYVAIIGLFGMILFLAQDQLLSFWPTPPAVVKSFISELGIALVIAAIAALLLENIIQKHHVQLITDCISPLNTNVNVLNGAKEVGLYDIFSRRRGEGAVRGQKHVYEALEEQIKLKKGEIRIAGVAALDIFRQRAGDPKLSVSSLLSDWGKSRNNCKIRVLLLDPICDAANYKQTLEPDHPTLHDIASTIQIIERWNKNFVQKIHYRLYKQMPIALIYLTDDWLFLEPYPNLKVEKNLTDSPIGGYSPMMMFKKGNPVYQRWDGHFEELWETSPENSSEQSTVPASETPLK